MKACQESIHVSQEAVTKTLFISQVDRYFGSYADTVVASVGELQEAQKQRECAAVSMRKRLLPSSLLMRTSRSYSDTEPDGIEHSPKRILVQRITVPKLRRIRSHSKALVLSKLQSMAKSEASSEHGGEQSTIKDVLTHVEDLQAQGHTNDNAGSDEITLLARLPIEEAMYKPLANSSMLTPIRCLDATCKLAPSHDHSQSGEFQPGDVLVKRYEILNEIERGGFGIVYRAKQIGIDRIVAIKRMRSSGNVEMSKRFLLEANIIKNLIHPNTIQLIDAGTDEHGCLYIVMEYIQGQSLRHVLDSGRCIGYERAVSIAMQVLKSMHEAHHHGIIHRDIKPSNILLREVIGEKDFVKVLDFGVAKVKSQASKLTQNGKILGSPQYISPELCKGKPAGPYSDLYALGLVFVQMVTGYSIVPSDAMQAIQCHLSDTPHYLPSWLERSPFGPVLRKALAKDYLKRYQDAKTMRDDLQKAMQSLHINGPLQSPNNKLCLEAELPLKLKPIGFMRSEKHLRMGMLVLLCLVNIILIYMLVVGLNGKSLGLV